MGLNQYAKIFVGIKIDNKDMLDHIGFYDPEYPDDYNGKSLEVAKIIYEKFDTCYDCMCGEYLYIGKEVYESEDNRWNPWYWDESYTLDELRKMFNEVRSTIGQIDKDHPYLIKFPEPKLHFFIHTL